MLRDVFFFSSRRRHTRLQGDWSSDVCSSDLRRLARMKLGMEWLQRLKELWRPGQRPRLALALAGGGVIGGVYEGGAVTAPQGRRGGPARFAPYVGFAPGRGGGSPPSHTLARPRTSP